MSYQYDQYLVKHKENVKKGYDWLLENLPELVDGVPNLEWQTGYAHDQSKSEPDEYEAYDAYFYGNNKSFAVVQEYRKAWLLHLHRNPHHWQHWILINDDPKEGEILIEMPINYILEMICDWWAFSWSKGNLTEIFKWYDEHKNYMKLNPNTRKKIEEILNAIKEKLTEKGGDSELAHHGIKGQKWGVRNGPPYPLDNGGVENTGGSGKMKMNLQMFANIPERKFTHYALDPEKQPHKARAFKEALGYTKDNYQELIDDIERHLDKSKLVEKTDDGFGMRYEQIMRLKGPNGKEANVLTGWIEENNDFRLTSVYVTEKKERKHED
ncbi:MAG: DUF5662 family protein [Ruminococcus flavefaciens]|nr:DUF5662 family protein [Ruminococcus flavefaciens]